MLENPINRCPKPGCAAEDERNNEADRSAVLNITLTKQRSQSSSDTEADGHDYEVEKSH